MRQAGEFPCDKCPVVSKSRQHATRMQEREWICTRRSFRGVRASKWSFRSFYLRCNKPERSLVRRGKIDGAFQLKAPGRLRWNASDCIRPTGTVKEISRQKWRALKRLIAREKVCKLAREHGTNFSLPLLSLWCYLCTRQCARTDRRISRVLW